VHGRLPSFLADAKLANREQLHLGISGEGDLASIGMGHFSATADRGPVA
jgi:2-oxoglutarate/2-oxoacid ferredoxin oxidoreductase subunit beta